MSASTTLPNTNATLLSLLCSEAWHEDPFDLNYISFREDGTGELVCREELVFFIAAYFTWKPQNAEAFDQTLDVGSQSARGSRLEERLVAQFDIELTLTKNRIPKIGYGDMSKYKKINDVLLKGEAFLPKIYRVSLEQGQFIAPLHRRYPNTILGPEYLVKYKFNLKFDKSPYPPRDEWREIGWGAPDAHGFWEWNEFSSRKLSKAEIRAANTLWKDCIIM